MAQKSEPAGFDQVYVLGIDGNGNPRGARFSVLKDSIVSAAMDLNYRVLMRQPDTVSALGMKLPIGYVFGTGKLVKLLIPNIRRDLYQSILKAARLAAQQRQVRLEAATSRTIH
jgi:hypothetical protein